MGGSDSKPVIVDASAVEKSPAPPPLPPPKDPRCIGLENYGNTCYCNSVLQLLYHCVPLRMRLLELYPKCIPAGKIVSGSQQDTVLARMCDFFYALENSKKTKGHLGPSAVVQRVRKGNPIFQPNTQQDAHEFAMFVLNELIDGERVVMGLGPNKKTQIQELLEGVLLTQTTCMECETTTSRAETFLDISVEIEPFASLSQCIRNFMAPEYMSSTDRIQCDACVAPCDVRRSLRMHKPPPALLIQLKRFKYVDEAQGYRKLACRVPFPVDLSIPVTPAGGTSVASTTRSPGTEQTSVRYKITAIIVHIGSGPNLGHYIACVRCPDEKWLRYDDESVYVMSDRDLAKFFGTSATADLAVSATAYLLLYQRCDNEM